VVIHKVSKLRPPATFLRRLDAPPRDRIMVGVSPADPRLPSALYYFCGHCEKRCGSLEAGCEDEDGVQYCQGCTRRMYAAADSTDRLAADPEFMPEALPRYYPMSYRRRPATDAPAPEPTEPPRRRNWRAPLS
jgi:hypothetical protein